MSHGHLGVLQDQDDAAEHAGPLAEIEFWRSRTVDLGGIRDQLDDTSKPLQRDSTCVLLFSHATASVVCTQGFHSQAVSQQHLDQVWSHAKAQLDTMASSACYDGACEATWPCAGVLQVVAILEQTKSSYLATFLSLRKAIQQEAVVAEDNLKFLQCLEQPCRTLASATAKVPPFCLPDINAHDYPPQAPSGTSAVQILSSLSWTSNPINTSCSMHTERLQHEASSSADFDL